MGNRTRFTPEVGKVYENEGGGQYVCLAARKGEACMQNTKSRWTLVAHGCGIYENGTIDWDYSTGGFFDK